jgi:LysM repeat protein
MKQRWWRIRLLFVVLAVVLGGVTSCSRSAAVRDIPVADAAEAEDTEDRSAELVPPSEAESDVVVSAVSSAPDTDVQPVPPAVATDVPVIVIPTAAVEQEVVTEPEPESPEPVATEEPQPASGSEVIWHTVSQGETLGTIAARYGTTTNSIAQANGIANPNMIYPGQRLKIPKSGSSSGSTSSGCRYHHTVKSGEWIWQLGRVYGVSGSAILRANGLTVESGSNIQPGTVLCIP